MRSLCTSCYYCAGDDDGDDWYIYFCADNVGDGGVVMVVMVEMIMVKADNPCNKKDNDNIDNNVSDNYNKIMMIVVISKIAIT